MRQVEAVDLEVPYTENEEKQRSREKGRRKEDMETPVPKQLLYFSICDRQNGLFILVFYGA